MFHEVRTVEEAETAERWSAIVVRGSEADGRVGSLSAFVLFQQVLERVTLPMLCGR